MATEPQERSFTVGEYLALEREHPDERYEYIDGHIRLMAGGTYAYAVIAMNIVAMLRQQLKGRGCQVVNTDLRVRLSPTRYVYPDVTVTCQDRLKRGALEIQSPLVVFEVLSPGTESYDRLRKIKYYRECATIEEYVLVDAEEQHVEVYRRAGAFWEPREYAGDDQVALKSLGISLPVTELYEDAELTDIPGEA